MAFGEYITALSVSTWQELVSGNITFADELDFEIWELDFIYEDTR